MNSDHFEAHYGKLKAELWGGSDIAFRPDLERAHRGDPDAQYTLG